MLGRAPQYQIADLKPIARFTADPTVLAVRAEAPWKTYAEFIAAAKAQPGKITFGSSGNYGTMHMPMAMLALDRGVQLTHVPYTGAGPAIIGLLGGQVDALATGPATIVQHVKAGKVRVLAHWGEARLASLPDVPSLSELGMPVDYAQWSGLFVPAGVPDAVVARLREAAKAAANDDRVKGVLLHGRQPGAVPRRAGIPALRRRGRREDDRGRAQGRQARVGRRRDATSSVRASGGVAVGRCGDRNRASSIPKLRSGPLAAAATPGVESGFTRPRPRWPISSRCPAARPLSSFRIAEARRKPARREARDGDRRARRALPPLRRPGAAARRGRARSVLDRLLTYGPRDERAGERRRRRSSSCRGRARSRRGRRRRPTSPRNCGLDAVRRIERGVDWHVDDARRRAARGRRPRRARCRSCTTG